MLLALTMQSDLPLGNVNPVTIDSNILNAMIGLSGSDLFINQICQVKEDLIAKLPNTKVTIWDTIRTLQPRNSSPAVLSNGSAIATSDLDKASLFCFLF